MHRDDFPDLKPIFVPKLHMKTLILAGKHLNILKNISHRPHRTHYLCMLVKIKEILKKMYFVHPQTFSAILYYVHTIYRLIFGPNLVPCPKSLNNNFQIFSFILIPQELQIRFLSSSSIQTDVQMQTTTFTCPS